MPREPLLLIGASVRAAAHSAAAAGFEVGAIDLFGDADLCRTALAVRRSTRFPADTLLLAESFPPGPWLYTGGMENYPRLVARLAVRRPLLGNGPDVLRRVRDPRQLAAWLERSGMSVAVPRIHAAAAVGAIPSAEAGSWLLKHRRSSGGLAVRPATIGDLMGQSLPTRRGRYLQRLIAGTSFGASYLAAGSTASFLGLAEQLAAPAFDGSAPFRYGGSITVPLDEDDRNLLEELGARLAGEFALCGLFGVDLIRDVAGRWWLLEVNPRPTASMDLWESPTAPPLVAMHVDAFRSGCLPSRPLPSGSTMRARRVVYSGTLCGSVPPELAELLLRGADGRGQYTIADVPATGSFVAPDQPLVTLFATGATREELLAALVEAERNVLELFAASLVD